MARINVFTKLTTALVALAALTIGCGTENNSPVASNPEPTFTQDAQGRTLVTFSLEATRRAAKVAQVDEGRTVAKVFDQGKASIDLFEANGNGRYDDLRVGFHVPEGALTAPVEITMTVYGHVLEDLVVAFEPGGLTFLQDATLAFWLGKDLVNTPLEEIQAWHAYGDGSVEEADPTEDYPFVRTSKTTVTIMIAVPGFSRYSTGGGW